MSYYISAYTTPSIRGLGYVLDRLFDDTYKSSYVPAGEWTYDEKTGVFTTSFDLPGFKRDEVTVEATQDSYLTITAKSEKRGSLTREYYLADLDGESVEASLQDGVLTVTCRQVAKAKPRKVEVR